MTEKLTPQVVVVSNLLVGVTTGQTCYPGENGFSAHWAEVTTKDRALEQTLSALADRKAQVVLRCAMLDVTGWVTKLETTDGGIRFVFSIDDLFYRNPSAGDLQPGDR
jgi:hypothetical protein